ncbi:UNVERIFIED_CONTAM: S-locus-specific glycoprotein BS29-2 [Sesamum latifolium]|uniref:S-locus-specific glycoprotein BS29-2 n=1 Tax=Sesamum latifolium TaxID=2727402 RepID=A0AAW2UHC1_9LAMI
MDAECILGIELRGVGVKDELIWHYESNGRFSVRSAYRVAMDNREEGVFISATEVRSAYGRWLWALCCGYHSLKYRPISDNIGRYSFDYPSDTRLPGMNMVDDPDTDQENYLTSWRNPDDPSPGNFTYRIVNQGLAEMVLFQSFMAFLFFEILSNTL